MPDPIDTEAERAELRAKAEAATPGPWRLGMESCDCSGEYPCGHGQYHYELVGPSRSDDMVCALTEVAELARPDAEFIAAANPATVLALLDEIDRLRAALARFSPTCREHGCLTAPPTEVPCAIPATDPGSETP